MPASLEPLLGITEEAAKVLEPVKVVPGPGLLMGQRQAAHKHVREQPWHRYAASFLAKGCTQREVAEICEVDPVTIGNLVAQPWFQEVILSIMSATVGGPDIMTMFEAERLNSLNTIIAIRDNEKTAPAVRLAAASTILDRAMGKPVQKMEHKNTTVDCADPVAETEMLLQQTETLKKKLGHVT